MTESLFQDEREKERKSKTFGTPEFRLAYRRYMNSPRWKKICEETRQRAGGRCERCGCVPIRLEVHHLTYERFQEESLNDLQALCRECHKIADEERILANRRKYEEAGEVAQYYNARGTYLSKKYGDNWYMHDCREFSEEFDSWLERKRESEYGW